MSIILISCVKNFSRKRGNGEVNVGRQFPASFRKYFEMNRIFSFALVVASLGTKVEIKRQQIKFSDSELGRILKQMDSHTLRCRFI